MRIIMIAYALVASWLFGWLTVYFGAGPASFVFAIFVSPVVIAFRMARQNPNPRMKEYCYLGIVTVLAISGTVFVVNENFKSGLDRDVLFRRRFAEFRENIVKEPEFKHVELTYQESKGIYVYVEGKVANEATHDRLIQWLVRNGSIVPSGYFDGVDYPGRKRGDQFTRLHLYLLPDAESTQP